MPIKISAVVKGTGPAICLFTDSLDPSGVGEHMLALASNLLYRYPILFVCPSSPKGDYVLERAAAIGCRTLALEVRGAPAAQAILADELRQMAVEIFHCHAGIGWEGHAGIYVARDSDIPVIIRTEHLPYLLTEPDDRLAYQQIVQTVDQLICVSQAAYDTYIKAGVPAQKLTVIRNGIYVPAPRYDRVGLCQELGLPPDAKIILTIARLTEQKGHTYLVDAIPTVLAQVPQAYFVWVGEGPLEDELRAQLQHAKIDERHVLFAGWRSDASELLAIADLFVLPSLFEGLPLVVLEAMAIGIPVVGTRVCGTWEAIEDGVNGRLVEARDSAALAAAVLEALTEPALVAEWCKAGRASIDQVFNVTRMVGELVMLYERLRTHRTQPVPVRELQLTW
ncbi:MAG: glycosyltransferase family 4 protein [Chloroflexi bacterium]|nr:glycosyltransferase family 4 protein [Chloroflexota bacterium]